MMQTNQTKTDSPYSLQSDCWAAMVARWRYNAEIVRACQHAASLVDERTGKLVGLVADTWECSANELEQAGTENAKLKEANK